MEEKSLLRKRMSKSVPLKLDLEDDGTGATFTRNFRLSFDFNAIAFCEERTGLGFLNGEIWTKLNATNISIMLYAAILANHPEYWTVDKFRNPTPEGLEVLRSYLDAGNMATVISALNDAFMQSLPADKRAELEANQKAEESKGANPIPPAVAAIPEAPAPAV
jgi:hypothetical protein